MKNTNIQSSQNLIIIKGIKDDLEALKAKAFYDYEHFFWEHNFTSNILFDNDELEKSFSVISNDIECELHYYIKCTRRENIDLSNIAIQFPELQFSQVVIQSKDDSIKYIEYSKWSPGVEFKLTIPDGFIKWQNSFSSFSIANIEEIYLKICFLREEKKFVFEENQYEYFDFFSLIPRANYTKKYRNSLLKFIENEQNLKSALPDFICERPSPIKINSVYDIIKFYRETLHESDLAKIIIIDLFTRTLENQSILTYSECLAINYAYQFLNIEKEILDFSKLYIEKQIQKADYYIKNHDDYCKLLSEYIGLIPEFIGSDEYLIRDFITKYRWLSSDFTNKYFDKFSEIPSIDIIEEAIKFQEQFFSILKYSRKEAKIFVDKRWELMTKIEKKLIECESNFQNEDFRVTSSIILNPYFFDNQLLKIADYRYKFPLLNDDDSEDQLF